MRNTLCVMPGLDPGIHLKKDLFSMDCRVKPAMTVRVV
jgi:hypothetical protein